MTLKVAGHGQSENRIVTDETVFGAYV